MSWLHGSCVFFCGIVDFQWPDNTRLGMRIGVPEAQDDAFLGVARPLPSGQLRIINATTNCNYFLYPHLIDLQNEFVHIQ